MDIAGQLGAIDREVGTRAGDGGDLVSVVLRRRYDSPVDDVWDAMTDPDRLKRWLYPVSGDLREGGSFQFEGNAGGDILSCQPPTLLRVTFGGAESLVELRLTGNGERTDLILEHTVPVAMAGSGAGALFVGPGWDEGLMALALFLDGEPDPVAVRDSADGKAFSRRSVDAWIAAVEASGTADAEQIAVAAEVAHAQFAPEQTETR